MRSKALIIVAHGSRRDFSNEEVRALGEKVKSLQGGDYGDVMTAFLEFAAPSLEESILTCINNGVEEVVVLPYFLASGKHVSRDVPEVLKKIEASYPNVTLILKEHIGSDSGMVKLLSDIASSEIKPYK